MLSFGVSEPSHCSSRFSLDVISQMSPLEEEVNEVDWKKGGKQEEDTGAGSPLEEEVKDVDWKRRRRRTRELGHLGSRR